MQKRDPVRVFVGAKSSFMHQTTDGKVRHQQPVELLADQFRGLAAQHDLRAAQMRFEFIKRCLNLPPLGEKTGQLFGRGPA